MQHIKNGHFAKHTIAAVLLFGFAFAVSADQMQQRRVQSGAAPVPAANTAVAPAFHPGAPSPTVPTPRTLMPEIVADGMTIGGIFMAFTNGNPVNVRSTLMMPTASSPSACRFSGTFQLKNTGGGAAPMFDVSMMADSQQGVRSNNTGYSISGMAAGASYTQSIQLDLAPDTYSVILDVDPYHKLKQSTQAAKKYLVKINASCGTTSIGGGVRKKPAPYIPVN